MKKNILITGASGFLGCNLVELYMRDKAYKIYATSRKEINSQYGDCFFLHDFDLTKEKNLNLKYLNIDYIIHCAGLAHECYDSPQSLLNLNAVNVQGTISLARQAIQDRVKKFIFISSAKVNGEDSRNRILQADDTPGPTGPYALSKLDAENALRKMTKNTETRLIIIRPPLIYGPAVKANFLTLIELINRLPIIPVNCFSEPRDYVYIENLYDFINVCIANPSADDQTFLVSDGKDITLDQLNLSVLKILNRKAFLLPLPLGMLKLCAFIAGKSSELKKVINPFQVSIEKNKRLLDWEPKFTMNEGLIKTLAKRQSFGIGRK